MSSVSGIVQTHSAIQQAQVQNQVQIAVAKKSLDAVKTQGDAVVQLLQNVANSTQRLDVRA